MALAAAEDDEVRAALARHPHDLALDVAALHAAGGPVQSEFGGERHQALLGALHQLIFHLHCGHERLAHRLHRHEFHHVQQLDRCAQGLGERLGLAADGETVLCQVDDQQDVTVRSHHESPTTPVLLKTNVMDAPGRESAPEY